MAAATPTPPLESTESLNAPAYTNTSVKGEEWRAMKKMIENLYSHRELE